MKTEEKYRGMNARFPIKFFGGPLDGLATDIPGNLDAVIRHQDKDGVAVYHLQLHRQITGEQKNEYHFDHTE